MRFIESGIMSVSHKCCGVLADGESDGPVFWRGQFDELRGRLTAPKDITKEEFLSRTGDAGAVVIEILERCEELRSASEVR